MFYRFDPIFKETLWGGKRIAEFKSLLPHDGVGESWEISAVPGFESIDIESGKTLSELLSKEGVKILGKRLYNIFGTRFPLLIKFIDTAQAISIQVHPNDEIAQRHHDAAGKTEAWVSLNPTDDAYISLGFNRPTSAEECRQRIANSTFEDLLYRHNVKHGEVFYIPAGRVHSLGPGNFILEVQQTSDVTYRIFDFNRIDTNGQPRQLHIDAALEAINFNDIDTSATTKNDDEIILHSEFFAIRQLDLSAPKTLSATDSFRILVCVDGVAKISDNTTDATLNTGDTILVSADTNELQITPIDGDCKIFDIFIP